MAGRMGEQVGWPTVIGLALLLMPLTTMWHEIGGHALACVVQGGRVAAIGAFYVDCEGLAGWPQAIVALAGATVDAALATVAWALWRRARGDLARLALWYVWVDKAMTAAGYLAFSGVTGFGDLAPGATGGGGLGPVPHPVPFRLAEVVLGGLIYAWIVRSAIRTLTTMLGGGGATAQARRRIAHGYYLTAGFAAVIVGLANPVGFVIVLMSAAASSFGGLAGLISVGFAVPGVGAPTAFRVAAHWSLVGAGAVALALFALVLGPTLTPHR